jgi:hypothetical protein
MKSPLKKKDGRITSRTRDDFLCWVKKKNAMKSQLLSGKGKISSPFGYLSTVDYKIEASEAEPIRGSIRVVSGKRGLSLYEHSDTLTLHLDDDRLLTILIKTPIDLTDDSWRILGSSSIRQS